jgi:hypothetical protein
MEVQLQTLDQQGLPVERHDQHPQSGQEQRRDGTHSTFVALSTSPAIYFSSFTSLLKTAFSEYAIAATGWLVAFICMIIAAISLVLGFRSESLTQKALDLAEWTAMKDYIGQCRDLLVTLFH